MNDEVNSHEIEKTESGISAHSNSTTSNLESSGSMGILISQSDNEWNKLALENAYLLRHEPEND